MTSATAATVSAPERRTLSRDKPSLHNLLRSLHMKIDGTLTFDRADGGTRLRRERDMDLIGPTNAISPMLARVVLHRHRGMTASLLRTRSASGLEERKPLQAQ